MDRATLVTNWDLTRHDHVHRFKHEICWPWIIRLCSVKTTVLEPRPPFPTQVAGRRPWDGTVKGPGPWVAEGLDPRAKWKQKGDGSGVRVEAVEPVQRRG